MAAEGPCDLLRVDQVGSLLRPAALKDAWARFDRGEISAEELKAQTQVAVRDVVGEQARRGVLPVSDGEFWRRGFQETFGNSVTGYAPSAAIPAAQTAGSTARVQVPESTYVRRQGAIARLQLSHNVLLDEYLSDRAFTNLPLKVTLTGPERLTQRFDLEGSGSVYGSFDQFMGDVIEIERTIIAQVIDAGCEYIHIDEPAYTAYVDPTSLKMMRDRGWDPKAGLARAIDADNAIIAGFPHTTFGLHICRGNAGGSWHREGAYDEIAEQLFNGLAYQRLLLEYDTERAGGFEPLRFVPKGRVAVLGLVSTKTAEVETVDFLLRRLEEASKFLPLEQLAVSPQCGFASGLGGNPLTEDEQWRKLELLRDVAEKVWNS